MDPALVIFSIATTQISSCSMKSTRNSVTLAFSRILGFLASMKLHYQKSNASDICNVGWFVVQDLEEFHVFLILAIRGNSSSHKYFGLGKSQLKVRNV